MTHKTKRLMPRSICWVFPAAALSNGIAYLFGKPSRTNVPSFEIAKSLMSIHQWGIVFMVGAVCLAVALTFDHRKLLIGSFFIGGLIYSFWSVCFLLAAIIIPDASLSVWSTYMLGAFGFFVTVWRFTMEEHL